MPRNSIIMHSYVYVEIFCFKVIASCRLDFRKRAKHHMSAIALFYLLYLSGTACPTWGKKKIIAMSI